MREFLFNWSVRVGVVAVMVLLLNAIASNFESPFAVAGIWIAGMGPMVGLAWQSITGQIEPAAKDLAAAPTANDSSPAGVGRE